MININVSSRFIKNKNNGEYLFSTTCKVTPVEETHLYKSNGNFVTEAVLNNQND